MAILAAAYAPRCGFHLGVAATEHAYGGIARATLAAFADGAVRLLTEVYEGRCTAQEAAHIASFATEGYVVFPRAVEPELVDELVDDLRSIARHPGRFVTTDHRSGRTQRLSDLDFDAFESRRTSA